MHTVSSCWNSAHTAAKSSSGSFSFFGFFVLAFFGLTLSALASSSLKYCSSRSTCASHLRLCSSKLELGTFLEQVGHLK